MTTSASPGDLLRTPKNTRRHGHARRSLQAATAVLHAALERQSAPQCMTRDGYIRYLLLNRPLVSIELALEAAGIHRVLPDWETRRRRCLLSSDMQAMGVPSAEMHALAIADDIGTLLGWSYVVEGSRLGARFILKAVESTRDPALIGATRFLRHGAGTDLWTTFSAALGRIDHDPSAIASACAAACAAFRLFEGSPPRPLSPASHDTD